MVKITGYPTEKNPDLLTRIIEASSNVGDLVFDCFAGSGTTLAAASELDRRWIGIDNSSEAIATILKRFTHGLKPMGDFVDRKVKTESLPLFEFTNIPNKRKANCRKNGLVRIINDFTLYAVASYSEQLRNSLDPAIMSALSSSLDFDNEAP